MKMKTVCEQTGLTDRAVRYYIEEGLVTPEYTENYLGRRSYDFSEENVAVLKDIVVLRKYGFAVAEIREMQAEPSVIPGLVEAVKERKRDTVAEEQKLLNVLLSIPADAETSIRSLSDALSAVADQVPIPAEQPRLNSYELAYRLFCRVVPLLLALAELLGCAAIVWISCMDYHYPKGSTLARVLTLVLLIPAVLTLTLPLLHSKRTGLHKLRKVASILCVLCLLPSLFFSIGIVNRSETGDIGDYRRFDADCIASRSPMLQDLFPLWAPTKGSPLYHYRYLPGFDETYDVYAEWSLDTTEFEKEVERANNVMEAHSSESYDLLTIQKGPWTCLFYSYKGYAPYTSRGDDPFGPIHSSYDYTVFAYDPIRLRVRYLNGYSLEDGAYEPYYLKIDWE